MIILLPIKGKVHLDCSHKARGVCGADGERVLTSIDNGQLTMDNCGGNLLA